MPSFQPKIDFDPEPEIPDDLEISNDSGSFKFPLQKEPEVIKPEMVDHATQTEMVVKEIKKKKSMKTIMRRLPKSDPSNKLLEVLEKTQKEKEILENSIIQESQGVVDAKSLIQLSMKYVTKSMNAYNRFFITSDSRDNSFSRVKSANKDERSDSNETLALQMKKEAITSAQANQLAKSIMFRSLLQKQDQAMSTNSLSKKKKVKKTVIRRRKISPSNSARSHKSRSLSKNKSKKEIYRGSNRSAMLLNPRVSGLKSRSQTRLKQRLGNSEEGRPFARDDTPPKQSKKRLKKIIRRKIAKS